MKLFKLRSLIEERATFTQIAIRAYGSVTSGAVPDSTIGAIDRLFDFVDSGVEKIDRVLNRTKYTEEQHRARHAKPVIDTAPAVKVTVGDGLPSSSTALAVRKFRIIEATDASTGAEVFVVTNGNARAECSTREMAEKILRALEAVP